MSAMRLIILLSITSALIGARMSLTLAREDEDPGWIVDTIDPKCSKPCGGGLRNVTYKCTVYKHSSGETRLVPEERCKKVIKPPKQKPCNQEPCTFHDALPVRSIEGLPYVWKSTKSWSKCMNGCFGGTQCLVNKCWHTEKKKWVNDINCAGLDEPRKLCQTCTEYVSCPPKWRVSDWLACSKTCGSGVRSREVFCATQLGADHFARADDSKCEKETKPHTTERCAKVDCLPEFSTSRWGPCKNANSANCGNGVRTREVQCVKTLASGTTKRIKLRGCVRRFGALKFPPSWMKCKDYNVPLSATCKEKRMKTQTNPKITSDNTTVVQMKRARRIRLQVGETAYVFPGTSVIIKCPVKDFSPGDLTWAHNDDMVEMGGKRIQMNYRGRLKIRSLRIRDEGRWQCIAGSANASLELHLRYPSEGFREYALRQPLLSKMGRALHTAMMADQKTRGRKRNRLSGRSRYAVQWVAGPWSKCTRTCGGEGTKKRQVRCERVKDKYYKVYPDRNCKKMGIPKPPSIQICGGFNVCPIWQIDDNRGKCTNQCLRPGFALQKDRIFCSMNNQRLPLKYCDQKKKPITVAECVNSKCQLAWEVSKWSNCSRTCGGFGVMARHLTCIWNDTKANAGYACNKYGIEQPIAFKLCKKPKCILECVDLTPQCKTLKPGLCRYVTYQRTCCKTCEDIGKMHKKKMMRKYKKMV